MQTAIRYVERKTDGLRGIGRITRVEFSKTGKTIHWGSRQLASLEGHALKANYIDTSTFEEFWISNPRRDGNDSLLPSRIKIDDDVREAYWLEIRGDESQLGKTEYTSPGKSKWERERLEKSVRRRDMDRRFRATCSTKSNVRTRECSCSNTFRVVGNPAESATQLDSCLLRNGCRSLATAT